MTESWWKFAVTTTRYWGNEQKNLTDVGVTESQFVMTLPSTEALTNVTEHTRNPDIPPRVAVWFALPCIGGTPFNTTINIHKSEATAKQIHGYWTVFHKLWRNATKVMDFADRNCMKFFIEWPTQCRYWTLPEVKYVIAKYFFSSYLFEGCMYGLVAHTGPKKGYPIKKPWRIVCNTDYFREVFGRRCNHSAGEHAPCEGRETRRTEGYTAEMAKLFHSRLQQYAAQFR